jgi:hypothetical protein
MNGDGGEGSVDFFLEMDWAFEMVRAVRRRVERCWEARAMTMASPSPLGLMPVIRTGLLEYRKRNRL